MDDEPSSGDGREKALQPLRITPQEAAVLRLVRDGSTVEEIAALLEQSTSEILVTLRTLAVKFQRGGLPL